MEMVKKLVGKVLPAVALCLVGTTAAHAQATRTWVSGVGDDANPCSRTAPCRTFAGAISKTAAGGQIDVLDPGGFGGVTITKSISIEAEGALAGVLVSGAERIIVNAGANDVVVLRGLLIEGVSNGLSGVRFLAGGALHVENCTINRFGQYGIEFIPSGASQLFVKDTVIRGNGNAAVGGGILVKPGASGSAAAALDTVRLERNVFGLRVEDNAQATVREGLSAGNGYAGFTARSTSAAAILNLESSVTVANGTVGPAGRRRERQGRDVERARGGQPERPGHLGGREHFLVRQQLHLREHGRRVSDRHGLAAVARSRTAGGRSTGLRPVLTLSRAEPYSALVVVPAPFIVGLSRSGTTLLRLMLDAHPDLAIPPETHFIPAAERACAVGEDPHRSFVDALTSYPTWRDRAVDASLLAEAEGSSRRAASPESSPSTSRCATRTWSWMPRRSCAACARSWSCPGNPRCSSTTAQPRRGSPS